MSSQTNFVLILATSLVIPLAPTYCYDFVICNQTMGYYIPYVNLDGEGGLRQSSVFLIL